MESKHSVVNKREHTRHNFIHNLEVTDTKTEEVMGDLADISVGGIQLICNAPIEENTIHQLRIDLEGKVGELTSILINAQVIRCQETKIGSLYSAGLKILKVDPDSMKSLTYLMDEYGLDLAKVD